MSAIEEIKEAFAATEKTVADTRAIVDEMKGKQDDYVSTDKLNKALADLSAKLDAEDAARDELKSRVDAVETAAGRPGAPGGETKADKTADMFVDGFMRKGREDMFDTKDMHTQSSSDGGWLVPPRMREGIQKRHRRTSAIEDLATVVSLSGGTYSVLIERGDAGYEWAGERETRAETDTPTIHRVDITTHELSALPKVSQRLLDNASFDVETYVINQARDRFARGKGTAFVTGSGQDRPKGFLSYSTATTVDESRAANTLQHLATGASGAFNGTDPANIFVTTSYELQEAYQANATWLMKNTTAAVVATLQDGDGTYLMTGMMNGEGQYTRRIQGRPVRLANDMPAIGANSLSIAYGDFEQGYTIVKDPNITMLRDPFTAKPHVLFYMTERVGGGVTDFDAIKLIKFA